MEASSEEQHRNAREPTQEVGSNQFQPLIPTPLSNFSTLDAKIVLWIEQIILEDNWNPARRHFYLLFVTITTKRPLEGPQPVTAALFKELSTLQSFHRSALYCHPFLLYSIPLACSLLLISNSFPTFHYLLELPGLFPQRVFWLLFWTSGPM